MHPQADIALESGLRGHPAPTIPPEAIGKRSSVHVESVKDQLSFKILPIVSWFPSINSIALSLPAGRQASREREFMHGQ